MRTLSNRSLGLYALAVALGAAGLFSLGVLGAREEAVARAACDRAALKAVQHVRRSAFDDESRAVFLWDAGKGLVSSANLDAALAAALATTNLAWRSDDPTRRKSGLSDVAGRRLAWRVDKDGKIVGLEVDAPEDTPAGEMLWIYSTLSAIVLAAVLALVVLAYWQERDWRRACEDERRTSEFLDAVAHDLKSPIAAVGLWNGLLRDGKVDVAKAVAVTLRENGRMSRLVQNLLEFGRLGLGRRTFACTRVDLVAAVRETADELGYAFEENGLSIVGADAVFAHADLDAVRRILVNLVGNAAKYAATDGPVEIAVRRDGDHARLEVLDRGPGIADYEKCFERHWRGTDAAARATGGFGIGLAVARELARGMHGDVTARARKGGGSTFTLDLEAAKMVDDEGFEPPTPTV